MSEQLKFELVLLMLETCIRICFRKLYTINFISSNAWHMMYSFYSKMIVLDYSSSPDQATSLHLEYSDGTVPRKWQKLIIVLCFFLFVCVAYHGRLVRFFLYGVPHPQVIEISSEGWRIQSEFEYQLKNRLSHRWCLEKVGLQTPLQDHETDKSLYRKEEHLHYKYYQILMYSQDRWPPDG